MRIIDLGRKRRLGAPKGLPVVALGIGVAGDSYWRIWRCGSIFSKQAEFAGALVWILFFGFRIEELRGCIFEYHTGGRTGASGLER